MLKSTGAHGPFFRGRLVIDSFCVTPADLFTFCALVFLVCFLLRFLLESEVMSLSRAALNDLIWVLSSSEGGPEMVEDGSHMFSGHKVFGWCQRTLVGLGRENIV